MVMDSQGYSTSAADVEATTKHMGSDLERLVATLRGEVTDALAKATAATRTLAVTQESGAAVAGQAAVVQGATAKASTDVQIAEQRRLGEIIYRLEQKSSTDAAKLEREKARVLLGIATENGAERARIEALYDAEIVKAKGAEAAAVAAAAKKEADAVIAESARAQSAVTAQVQQLGDAIRGRLAGVADAIGSAFTTGFHVAAVAITGVAVAATYTGAEFQQKMQSVGVIAGATGEQMQALSDKARELGATTAFSASQAADAMHNLASGGMGVADVLRATGDALVLAGAGGTDLATSSAALTATLAQFSLQADQSGRVADVFAKATAGSMFEVQDLAEAMKYGGVVGASFGYSLEQTVSALSLFRNAGLQGSAAGTALRSALVGATQASAMNVDALAKYGLTMADINPATHDFAQILQTVGTAGMSTADAIKVFGTESGAVVATLAAQMKAGDTQYQDMLGSLENATGAATAMYAQMNDTVTGSFAELSSGAEEFLLTLFDTYKGPLVDLLTAVTDVVNRTVGVIRGSSGEISASMGTALGAVTDFITKNADFIAESIAGFVRGVADFAAGVQGLMPYLQALLPLVDDIALAMGVLWASIKVAQFVSAVEGAITVLGSLGVSVESVMAIMTAASGGTYALAAAVGTLVVGLGYLITRYLDAGAAADRLKEAQDRLAAGAVQADASRAQQLEAMLVVQRAEAKAQLEQEAAAGTLTAARRAELQMLSTLTGATAQQAEAVGELVLVNGKIRTAGSIAEQMDTDVVSAFNAQVQALGSKATEASKQLVALQAAVVAAQKAGDSGMGATYIATLLHGTDVTVDTVEAARAKVAALQDDVKQYSGAAAKLSGDYAKTTSAMLETVSRAQAASSKASLGAVQDETTGKTTAEAKYVDKVESLHNALAREVQLQGADATQQLKIEMQARQVAVAKAYAEQVVAAGENGAEVTRLQAQEQADQLTLLGLWANKQQAIVDAAARSSADRRAAAEARAQGMITAYQRAGMTDAERLEAEKADALLSIADASAQSRLEVEAYYNDEIAALPPAEPPEEEHPTRWEKMVVAAQKTIDAIKAVASTVATVFSTAEGAVSGFVSFWMDALEKLTGFTFSLSDAMTAITDATGGDLGAGLTDGGAAPTPSTATGVSVVGAAAAEGNGAMKAASAADNYVQGLVDQAVEFVTTLAGALPSLVQALVSGIPDVVDALLAQLPDIIAAVADAIPALVQTFADQMPRMLDAIVAGLPQLIDAIVTALPILIQSIVDAIPVIIQAILDNLQPLIMAIIDAGKQLVDVLLEQLPVLIDGILQMIPDIITALMAQLPDIITKLLAAVTQIIMSILDVLPDIITAILVALPDIIIALVDGVVAAIPTIIGGILEAVPQIIVAVIGAIPLIINTVLESIPKLIDMVVGMIPDLIMGIVDSIPTLITGVVESLPDLLEGAIVLLPQLIIKLFEALFFELPMQIPSIIVNMAKALIEAIKSIWSAIVDMVTDLWNSLFHPGEAGEAARADTAATTEALANHMESLVASILALRAAVAQGVGERLGGASAYTGATYVPATMRMTVHPGEVILPAGRQAAYARDRADPAMAGSQSGPGGGGGGSFAVDVLVDGRVVESVLMQAQKRGTATQLTRLIRTTAGVKAGLDRGKFNRWGK